MTAQEALIKTGLAFVPAQYRKTIELLDEKPMSCDELSKQLDTSLEYARIILGKLHKAKVTHIVSWRRIGRAGVCTKVWGLGIGDAKQPQKMTPTERTRKHRALKKGLSGEVRLGVWGL
jgi:hypothetical protein